MPFRRHRRHSARAMLRAYQAVRGDVPDPRLAADLQFVQAKDLDLSVRIGALLDGAARLTRAGWRVCVDRPAPPALRVLQHAVVEGWLPADLARAQTGRWQLLGGAPGPA